MNMGSLSYRKARPIEIWLFSMGKITFIIFIMTTVSLAGIIINTFFIRNKVIDNILLGTFLFTLLLYSLRIPYIYIVKKSFGNIIKPNKHEVAFVILENDKPVDFIKEVTDYFVISPKYDIEPIPYKRFIENSTFSIIDEGYTERGILSISIEITILNVEYAWHSYQVKYKNTADEIIKTLIREKQTEITKEDLLLSLRKTYPPSCFDIQITDFSLQKA